MGKVTNDPPAAPQEGMPRRTLLRGSSVAMGFGLAASYGTLAVMAGRFLYPAGRRKTTWMFVTQLGAMAPGASLELKTPLGEKILIARHSAGGTKEDFVALSSVCPHLGCQVRWEPHKDRFYCPCHNGVFDPQGKAVSGPPAAAGQSLPRYELEVENNMLFIEVPIEGLGAPRET